MTRIEKWHVHMIPHDTRQVSAVVIIACVKIDLGAKDLGSGHQVAFHASSVVGVAGWAQD